MYALLLPILLISVVGAVKDGKGRDLHACTYCECWYRYSNRDTKLSLGLPFGEVVAPTIDECLSLCARDYRCQAATYGLVGGRKGVICELYERSGLPYDIQYQYGFDYFEPWRNMPCNIPIPAVSPDVRIQAPDPASIEKRKKFATEPNPNYLWGRK